MTERATTTKAPESKTSNPATSTQNTGISQSHAVATPVDHILNLQRTIGNQDVQRMLQTGTIQAKLTIGQPNDPYEQEADRVAEQVMRMPENTVVSPPDHAVRTTSQLSGVRREDEIIQRMCTECEEEQLIQQKPFASTIHPVVQRQVDEEEEVFQAKEYPGQEQQRSQVSESNIQRLCPECEEERIQRKATHGHTSKTNSCVFSHIASVRGGGQPLSASTRTFFEPRFGQDFSMVRVHIGRQASRAARAIQAKAFTMGQDISFGTGQFSPESGNGKRLLAHELMHVVQQGGPKVYPDISKVQRQPDAGVSDAGPKDAGGAGQTRQHKGVTVSSDEAYTYELLKRIFIDDGYEEMQDFVISFSMDVLRRRPRAGVTDDPELIRDESILATLQEQSKKLSDEQDAFIAMFENHAKSVTKEFLNENKKHVLAEAVRYGIRNLHLEFSFWGFEIAGDVADNASTRGLAIAAQGLLDRKRKADQAMEHYVDFTHGMSRLMELASERGYGQESELAEKRGKITLTQRDLEVYRVQVQTKFPLLADLGSDQDFKWSELEDLAKGSTGKNSSATQVIIDQILEKLTNIRKVREELKPGGDVNIWLVPEIVEPMRAKLNVTPGTFYKRIVDDKIKDEKPSWITGILIGLLQLGLVLLAPVTGGLTLAAIGVGVAYQHFKEYQLKKAMHGTDFGAAALSTEDPSLFWLAVDIIGAGFDVTAAGGAAFRLFRRLAPAARAVRGAQAGDDAVRTLERNARELGGEVLARRVGENARALQRGARKEVGITAEETRRFEQAAADVVAQELREGAQTAITLAGGKVTVSRSGVVFSCSSPCAMMRERFKELLAREPKYSQRLNQLEDRARKLPGGAEGNIERKQLANEAAALEREMRTTSLPGDWTSPLKEADNFNQLVNKRGSVAAKLDHHPLGWTGKDEALFRYGDKAKPQSGYRWTLDKNGSLRYERLDTSRPPRQYDPARETFEDATEEGLIRAKKGAEEARELAKLPQKERKAMEAAFKKRRNLIAERDRLEALKEAGTIEAKDVEKLKKHYAKINEQSRQLGEHAAEGVMRARGGKKVYPIGKSYSTSGDFDQVYKVGDEFHIVEAKGGSGSLGSRSVGVGARAEQGTIEYAKSIAENMAKNGATKEIRQLGYELQAAIMNGKVVYILVRAPIGTKAGAAVLSDVKVSEFVLK